MNEELEVLKSVTQRLNKEKIPYMVSGSIAANYYTLPRMTRDIDVIIELKNSEVDKFVSLFQDDYYVDKETVKNEVWRGGMFNLIHDAYIIKIDFIMKEESLFQKEAFRRRRKVLIEKSPMWFISSEDLIVSKLLWAKDSHSEVQIKDIRNLLETTKGLDRPYVESWVKGLNLEEIYKEATNE